MLLLLVSKLHVDKMVKRRQQQNDYNMTTTITTNKPHRRIIIINTKTSSRRRYTDKNNSKFNDDVATFSHHHQPTNQQTDHLYQPRCFLLTFQNNFEIRSDSKKNIYRFFLFFWFLKYKILYFYSIYLYKKLQNFIFVFFFNKNCRLVILKFISNWKNS